MGKERSVFQGLTATKSLKRLNTYLEGLKQFFMPCGFAGQQPSGYNASTEVSCLLLLYLLMVSSPINFNA